VTQFEGLPGESTRHDFGEVDVCFLNGTKKRVHAAGRVRPSEDGGAQVGP
jgi:hypothetical protein